MRSVDNVNDWMELSTLKCGSSSPTFKKYAHGIYHGYSSILSKKKLPRVNNYFTQLSESLESDSLHWNTSGSLAIYDH